MSEVPLSKIQRHLTVEMDSIVCFQDLYLVKPEHLQICVSIQFSALCRQHSSTV